MCARLCLLWVRPSQARRSPAVPGQQAARCSLEVEPQKRQGGGRKNGSCGSLHTSAARSLVPLQVCYLMGASFLPKLECFFGPATPVLAFE